MPTSTPPPYFPQNALSPGDEKTRRRIKLVFFGCLGLLALALVAGVVGLIYLFTR